ncbi:MAG: hypothetical protein BMS9Abin18_0127 [Zetaproteobacteria bacterium]|nr:MAG: hypothetical protein BMS9Abin18_0127 [Zetaproteobacteria bacterium]
MINMDNPQFGGLLVILIALVGPIVYSFFIDKHKKGTPDPRSQEF